MKKRNLILLLLFLFSVSSYSQNNIDSLLMNLAQEDDLSMQTKKEGAGTVLVFTRQDLDRLQVRSLKELLDYLPYFRYNEDSSGFSSPFYVPYQPSRAALLRVYINDRELTNPFYGSSLQVFGRMNISYIDHVEIYSGGISFGFGIETAATTIKLYTKDPEREDTNLIGVLAGTNGTSEVYGYSAKSFEDFSYLLHINRRDLNRDKINKNGYELSRDSLNNNIFMLFKNGNYRAELQAVKGDTDAFLGNSVGMMPEKNDASYNYLYGALHFNTDDDSINAYMNFARSNSSTKERTDDFIGIGPFGIYQNLDIEVTEEISDIHFMKKWENDTNTLLLGITGRYKHFSIDKLKYDSLDVPIAKYNQEFILSPFIEISHMFNPGNMMMFSFKYDNYDRNGEIDDSYLFNGRLAYIYNTKNFSAKFFLSYGEFAPEPYLIFNNILLGVNTNLGNEKSTSIGLEFNYKQEDLSTSLILSKGIATNALYNDFVNPGYKNFKGDFSHNSIELKSKYSISQFSQIDTSIELVDTCREDDISKTHTTNLRGYVSLLNTFGKFSLANSLHYYGLDHSDANGAGYNYNAAITYNYNRDLSFFIKGTNILGKALTSDYIRINPLTGDLTTLKDVDIYDRAVWIGMEYQF